MPCDVFDKAWCFLGNGQYDSGLAGGGEIQAGEVEARQDTHAIRMNGLSRSVQRISKSHIAEIALEACTPHHARDAGSGKIERTDEGIRRRHATVSAGSGSDTGASIRAWLM